MEGHQNTLRQRGRRCKGVAKGRKGDGAARPASQPASHTHLQGQVLVKHAVSAVQVVPIPGLLLLACNSTAQHSSAYTAQPGTAQQLSTARLSIHSTARNSSAHAHSAGWLAKACARQQQAAMPPCQHTACISWAQRGAACCLTHDGQVCCVLFVQQEPLDPVPPIRQLLLLVAAPAHTGTHALEMQE